MRLVQGGLVSVVAAALAICAAGCNPDKEAAVTVPPLRPLATTESASDTPAQAKVHEDFLLTEFRKTGRIPVKSSVPTGPIPDSTALGDNIIDSDVVAAKAPDPLPAPKGRVAPEKRGQPVDLSRPEGLSEAVFNAVVHQDHTLYQRLLIDAEGLQALAGVKPKTAEKRAAALKIAAEKPYALFTPQNASEEPSQGLASMLELKDVEVGKPGTIWGKTPRKGEETVQHWGTSVAFTLKAPDSDNTLDEQVETNFSITLGRMLKTPSGEWRLASAPKLAGGFHTFLTAGFHLKPEILKPEHYPFPLSVGNFWLFHVRKPNSPEDTARIRLETPIVEEVRIEVTHVEHGRGYRVVTLRRHHKAEETKSTTFHYLVTPKRLYTCNRYCKSRSNNLSFVLDYVRQRVPVLVLPLAPDVSWGPGGELVERKGKYRTAPRLELTVVPAGEFSETVVVFGESGGMKETRHFKSGTGFVRRQLDTSAGPRVEELVKFRILTAE